MERIIGEVISAQGTEQSQIARTLAFLLIASVLFTFPAATQNLKTTAEYLIVEHVDQLLVYNKYQQRITPQEKETFVPFVPMRILESHCVLSDNFTQCMKVEMEGRIFYLIKNNGTTLLGAGKLGVNRIFSDVVLLRDTIQLMTKSDIVFIFPDHTQRIPLQGREKLIRYFQEGDLTYIRLLNAPSRFAWVRLDDSVFTIAQHGKKQDNQVSTGVPDKTLERIGMKFREVNAVLINLFSYFNNQLVLKKSVPQWHSVESGESIVYVIEPQSYSSCFPESDRYLTRDLDNILIGSSYAITYVPGKIEIHQK